MSDRVDDDLVRIAVSGHRGAFDRLIERTSRLVWSHLILRTRDRSLTEDLTQETFLRAWRSISELKDPATFRGWLIRIAENVRLDEIKHRTRTKRGEPIAMESSDEPMASGLSPDEQAGESELTRRAIEAIHELPEQYQQVLSLRYLAGADYEQMSQQLALTNGSLRGLLHRGLEMLRERLEKEIVH